MIAASASPAGPGSLAATDPVDLHLHTHASDGAWTPDGLIDYLAERRFRVASVCDHDTQRSVAEAIRLGKERGVHIVPGVEVTTRWANRQWHLLVYGIHPERTDEAALPFQAVLADLDTTLSNLAADARGRVEDSSRPLPSLPDIVGERPMWPFQVLSALIKDGHAKGLKEAAELVTELGGGFSADEPLEHVVEAAHRAGGICVIAHPGRGDTVGEVTESDLAAILAEMPIDGLEAHYRSYTDEQTARYRDLAERHGLLISCGSDSHAPKTPVDPRPWRAAWCAGLLARLGFVVEMPPIGAAIWAPGMDPDAVVPAPPDTVSDDPAAAAPKEPAIPAMGTGKR